MCDAADEPPVENGQAGGESAARPGRQAPVDIRGIQKANDGDGCSDERIALAGSNDEVAEALPTGEANLAAGTAWLWAREEMAGTVDVLVVDEAGQMSLANTLAVCQAAGSLVLLGDPRQLDQPIQGVHPPGADVSALGHLLGESATVDPSRGVFLDQTWRMHPDICAFTTEQFYEGRLRPQPALRRQTVAGPGPLAGHGLCFIPVEHAGNTNASAEESECVAALIGELLDAGAAWVGEGIRRPLTLQDVLVVAPYNANVAVLRSTLPAGARVGTVNKFQGQEAPIVIYSMATSTADEAPRGMEFLYSLHRPQRRHLARPLRGRDRRQSGSPRAGLPHPGADAPGQSLLPLPRAGAARSRTHAPKLTYAPFIRPKAGPGAHPDPRGSARPGYPSEAEWEYAAPSGDDDPYGGHLRHVFQLLERQNLQGVAGRLGLHVHRLTRPERIRHLLPGPLRGLLHGLDLHQAGYRASADGPFLDMALYDRFQRLEDIRDLPPRQRRVLRDIRKQLRFRHGHGEFLDSCQHFLLGEE